MWQAKSRPKSKIKRHHKSTRRLSSDDDDDDAGSGSCHGDRQKESVECEVNMKQKNNRNRGSKGGVGDKANKAVKKRIKRQNGKTAKRCHKKVPHADESRQMRNGNKFRLSFTHHTNEGAKEIAQ